MTGHKKAEQVQRKAEQAERDERIGNLRNYLEELRGGKDSFNEDIVGSYMKEAQEYGLEEIAQEFAEFLYNTEVRNGRGFKDRLKAAEILGRTDLPIREQNLFQIMTANWAGGVVYVDVVRENSEGIPEKNVKRLAEKAYRKIDDHLQAAQLAKLYLGEKELHKTGRDVIEEENSGEIYGNHWEHRGRAISELELPDEMVRPLMIRIFDVTLTNEPTVQAIEIEEKYNFTDEEMRPLVNRAESWWIGRGNFEIAFQLRERYGRLIEDQSVSTEDLRTLAGISNYQSEEE